MVSMANQTRLYPESKVELTPFTIKHYDTLINMASFGLYKPFIRKAIRAMDIQPDDRILDFGCGTGRNACLMAKYLSPGGKVVGLDISEIMGEHFEKKCRKYPNLEFRQQRVDQSFDHGEKYDKVFMSFVFHGFPQDVRHIILENALRHLRKGGTLNILDYAEFDVRSTPLWFRIPFRILEGKCKYAWDYLERDWKQVLSEYGFGRFEEHFFIRGHLRLLKAEKIE